MTAASPPLEASGTHARTRHGRPSSFRPDIEGLRALAIGLVLVYHAGVSLVPGGYVGVDVFFVISGFLITGMLLREFREHGRISLTRFYSRRAKRLLPAATLALGATAALTWWLAPALQRGVYGHDILASAVSLVNWRLADRSVDYQAEGIGASPVQHYWSLAVEEQFYIVWPLVIVAAGLAATLLRLRASSLALGALAAIVVLSFMWSIHMTADAPAQAFFVTTTRLWELGIGGLMAASVALWRRLPRGAALILGWAGVGAVVASALVFDSTTNWPGAAALVPTLGTAAVIAAGTASSSGAPRPLSLRPAVWIGGLSYSLYLWHWPMLVAAGWHWGEIGQKAGLAIVAASFIPAWLSYKFVENPVRRASILERMPALTLSLGANLVAVTVVVALLLAAALPRSTPAQSEGEAGEATRSAEVGAQSLDYDGEAVSGVEVAQEVVPFVPDLVAAREDFAVGTRECHADFETVAPEPCVQGAPDGDVRVFLAGDSKAAQWGDTLEAIATDQGWVFESATKSACGFADALRDDGDGRPYAACPEFNANLVDLLLADPPDAVIVSQRHSQAFAADGELSGEVMVEALAEYWSTLEGAGIEVIVLLDNPTPTGLVDGAGSEVTDCLAAHVEDPWTCQFSVEEGIQASGAVAQLAAAELVPAVDVVDMTDTLCNAEVCPPVIGGVLVYRQGSHVTNTYAMTSRHILEDRLAPLVDPSDS
ncbi:acyltransferase family protein [Demequina sp. SO4-18]|uniref:acyltransferase family protein n=1 Tax=Demequina sp. SO4-18 TaxID=3401026 RepID=UPI003B5C440E